jgi:hypothetical protein
MVVARDCSGQTIDFIAGRGGLTADALHTRLLPKLQTDVILVSDANAACRRFASEAGIVHEWVNPRKGVRSRRTNTGEAIHVQNVNSYHSRSNLLLLKSGSSILRASCGIATAFFGNGLSAGVAETRAPLAIALNFSDIARTCVQAGQPSMIDAGGSTDTGAFRRRQCWYLLLQSATARVQRLEPHSGQFAPKDAFQVHIGSAHNLYYVKCVMLMMPGQSLNRVNSCPVPVFHAHRRRFPAFRSSAFNAPRFL